MCYCTHIVLLHCAYCYTHKAAFNARSEASLEGLRLIITHPGISLKDLSSALTIAFRVGDMRVAKLILDRADAGVILSRARSQCWLVRATELGNIGVMQRLLELGADIGYVSRSSRMTASMVAVRNNNMPAFTLLALTRDTAGQ